jgi:hypothetical protein
MSPDDRQCEGMTKAGARCQARPMPNSPYCFFHDPDKATARDQARRKGGRNAIRGAAVLPVDSADAPLGTVADVVVFLADTANKTRRGELDPKVCNASCYAVGLLLRALEGDQLAKEIAELRAQVEVIRNAQQSKKTA